MLRNVKIKRSFKRYISPVLSLINRIIPKNKNLILLYSANGGIEHNLSPLKEYLLNNNYDKKYKIFCGVADLSYAESDKNRVRYIGKILSFLLFYISKHVFYTTGQIPIKPSKNQIVIHLDHGTATIKANNLMSHIQNGDDFFFTYYAVPNEIYIPIVMKEFNCGNKNIIINGEPVNDYLLAKHVKYPLGNYDKIGLWAPTFRQSDFLGYNDSNEGLLPAFSESDYEELNDQLIKYNFRLIVKLHPCQNINTGKTKHFSNLFLYSDKEFIEQGWNLYSLLAQVDFLIGDYSSVSLQYLLIDKPQAFVIPDIEEYKCKRGFVFDDPLCFMPGKKVYQKNDLYSFFEELSKNIDDYKEERKRVRNLIYRYQDANNCKRILEVSKISI